MTPANSRVRVGLSNPKLVDSMGSGSTGAVQAHHALGNSSEPELITYIKCYFSVANALQELAFPKNVAEELDRLKSCGIRRA